MNLRKVKRKPYRKSGQFPVNRSPAWLHAFAGELSGTSNGELSEEAPVLCISRVELHFTKAQSSGDETHVTKFIHRTFWIFCLATVVAQQHFCCEYATWRRSNQRSM